MRLSPAHVSTERRLSQLPAGEATAGHRPGDVQAVAPEDLSAESGLSHGVEAGDRTPGLVESLELLVDGGSALGGGEVSLCRAEQRPLSVVQGRPVAGVPLLVGLSNCLAK